MTAKTNENIIPSDVTFDGGGRAELTKETLLNRYTGPEAVAIISQAYPLQERSNEIA